MYMNTEILNVINAVLDFKKFMVSNSLVMKTRLDWFSLTEEYFNKLPLPDGMFHNRATFEKILNYGRDSELLNQLNNMEEVDLKNILF